MVNGVLTGADLMKEANLPDEDPGSDGWPVQGISGGQGGVILGQVQDSSTNFTLKGF